MDWKKWLFVGLLLVGGTYLLPLGQKGILGIVLYMVAIHTVIDHYQHEMSQYKKVILSLLGGGVLTYIMTTMMGFFITG